MKHHLRFSRCLAILSAAIIASLPLQALADGGDKIKTNKDINTMTNDLMSSVNKGYIADILKNAEATNKKIVDGVKDKSISQGTTVKNFHGQGYTDAIKAHIENSYINVTDFPQCQGKNSRHQWWQMIQKPIKITIETGYVTICYTMYPLIPTTGAFLDPLTIAGSLVGAEGKSELGMPGGQAIGLCIREGEGDCDIDLTDLVSYHYPSSFHSMSENNHQSRFGVKQFTEEVVMPLNDMFNYSFGWAQAKSQVDIELAKVALLMNTGQASSFQLGESTELIKSSLAQLEKVDKNSRQFSPGNHAVFGRYGQTAEELLKQSYPPHEKRSPYWGSDGVFMINPFLNMGVGGLPFTDSMTGNILSDSEQVLAQLSPLGAYTCLAANQKSKKTPWDVLFPISYVAQSVTSSNAEKICLKNVGRKTRSIMGAHVSKTDRNYGQLAVNLDFRDSAFLKDSAHGFYPDDTQLSVTSDQHWRNDSKKLVGKQCERFEKLPQRALLHDRANINEQKLGGEGTVTEWSAYYGCWDWGAEEYDRFQYRQGQLSDFRFS